MTASALSTICPTYHPDRCFDYISKVLSTTIQNRQSDEHYLFVVNTCARYRCPRWVWLNEMPVTSMSCASRSLSRAV